MKSKHLVKIAIRCQSAEEMQKAIEVINYHLETLNPHIKRADNRLIVQVSPLDSQLFAPDEACDIIRRTLAQSLTFIHGWTCTLHTIN